MGTLSTETRQGNSRHYGLCRPYNVSSTVGGAGAVPPSIKGTMFEFDEGAGQEVFDGVLQIPRVGDVAGIGVGADALEEEAVVFGNRLAAGREFGDGFGHLCVERLQVGFAFVFASSCSALRGIDEREGGLQLPWSVRARGGHTRIAATVTPRQLRLRGAVTASSPAPVDRAAASLPGRGNDKPGACSHSPRASSFLEPCWCCIPPRK